MTHFRGIFPAVVTPFDAEGKLFVASFEQLIDRLDRHGVHGVYVCGSTGEGMLQTVAQRKHVAEVAVKCLPASKPVLVHVGAHRMEDAIELARHASRIGAGGISSLPPHGDYTFGEIRDYYQLLARASDVPLFIYHLPDLYPAITTLDHLSDLCAIKNVVGVKLTTADLSLTSALTRQGAIVFAGRDDLFVAGLMLGAYGGIGSFHNLVPQLFVELYRFAELERWKEARAVQDTINELITITLRFPAFPAIKAMLGWSGIDCGTFLPPRRPLTASEELELRELLSRSSVAEFELGGLNVR